MAHSLTDSAAYTPDNVVVPDDGDLRNAASVTTPFQTLADRTAYLQGRLNGSVAANTSLNGNLTLLSGGLFNGGLQATIIADSGGNQVIDRNKITVVTNSGAAAFNLTIFGTGQHDGDWVIVHSNTTNTCTVKDPGGSTILQIDGGGGLPVCMMAIRIADNWVVFFRGKG